MVDSVSDELIVLLEKLYETSILADQISKIRWNSGRGSGRWGSGRVEEKRTLYLSDFDVASLLTSTLHKFY